MTMELEPTWGRAAKVWWAFAWRNLIALVCVMIVGGILGGLIGLFMGAFGASVKTIEMVAGSIGFILGILISIVPVRLILGKDFGDFRLVLLKNEEPA